ncbi:MAG: RpiB/LacA/LacB family sugar-phosphate isomerase [Gammaproteobacteria bacterium]
MFKGDILSMKIALGADKYGFLLKESVKNHLVSQGHDIQDFGVSDSSKDTPYYTIADEVARLVGTGEYERAILCCGTGMGMSIIANKHPGIYASVCDSIFAAEKSRSINNSNILTLGGMVTADLSAKEIVDIWLKTEFTQGWDAAIQEWLRNSMNDTSTIEKMQFKAPNS